jgi:hypothetical protein
MQQPRQEVLAKAIKATRQTLPRPMEHLLTRPYDKDVVILGNKNPSWRAVHLQTPAERFAESKLHIEMPVVG